VSGDEEYLILTNQREQIELWNLKSKMREELIQSNSGWNSISVSSTPGKIYLQLDSGEITELSQETLEKVKVYGGEHRREVAYTLLTWDDKSLVTLGWD
jgi:hypothetical protein